MFLILYALKNTGYPLRISTFIAALLLFYAVNEWLELKFKNYHYIIFAFVSGAGILFSPLYFVSANYDKILHLVSPIFLSVLIFFLLNKAKIKFSIKIFLTFSVMVMFLSLFEIGEYVLDQLFDFKLQGVYLRDLSGISKLNIIIDKNDDTMIDMMFGMAGALTFVVIKSAIFYQKKFFTRKKYWFKK
jgi:membrane-associated HD superfamily phosphohydrolase